MLNFVTRRPWFYIILIFLGFWILEFWMGGAANSKSLRDKVRFSKFATRGCGDDIIRGVNLGGWLLLEPWITPSIFDQANMDLNRGKVVDEWTYYEFVHDIFAKDRLKSHWDEFISKSDLITLANSGITHLRIPIPYWMFIVWPEDPLPNPGSSDEDGRRPYLKRLVKWCEDIGLKVILDLHGAPGSQNGMDHSGRRGKANWSTEENIQKTLIVIQEMINMISNWVSEGMDIEVFYGISVINEPLAIDQETKNNLLENFYPKCFEMVNEEFGSRLKVIIDHGFMDISHFRDYKSKWSNYDNIILDIHSYHAFGQYWNDMAETKESRMKSWEVHKKMACQFPNKMAKTDLDVYIGEWSLGVSDCQKYLHGGYSSSYTPPDANGDACLFYNSKFSSYSRTYKTFMCQFMLTQIEAYESTSNSQGWFFWTAKTENHVAPEWDYLFLLKQGIAPNNLCKVNKTMCPHKS